MSNKKKIEGKQLQISPSSQVLLVSNLPSLSDISVQNIFNLFSCFGNIRAILYLTNSGKCFIQFSHLLFAQACQSLVNLHFFMGQKLKISFSNRKKLDLRQKKNSLSKKYNQVKRVKKNEHRYQNYESALIPVPSDTILVIGIPICKQSKISQKTIFSVMRDFQYKPKKIMVLKGNKKLALTEEFKKRGKLKNLEKALLLFPCT